MFLMERKTFRVGIIGGGIAGLSTAYHLLHREEEKRKEGKRREDKGEEEDLEVVILEARDRLGGRAFSKPEEDGIDRGAGWVHGAEPRNPFYNFLLEKGLQLEKNSFLPFEATIFKRKEGGEMEEVGVKDGMREFNDAIDEMMEEGTDDPNLSFYDEIVDYLPNLNHEDPMAWKTCIVKAQHMEGTHPNSVGLMGISECTCPVDLTKNLTIKGGFGSVVGLFEREIREKGGDIRLNCAVKCIQWEEGRKIGGAALTWTKREGGEEEKMTEKFDAVIICLPVGCYEDVNFLPEISHDKRRALSCLNRGTTEKHILIFDKVFWKSSRFAIPELEISFTSMEKSTSLPLLYIWVSRNSPYFGSPAEFFAELVTKCWCPVGEVKVVRFIRSNWGGDEWSKGSYLSPGLGSEGPDDFAKIQAPTPPLFFAGEGTGEPYGETSGAFVTGRAAAMQCLKNIVNK